MAENNLKRLPDLTSISGVGLRVCAAHPAEIASLLVFSLTMFTTLLLYWICASLAPGCKVTKIYLSSVYSPVSVNAILTVSARFPHL